MVKKLLAGLLAGVLALSLAACGSTPAAEGESVADENAEGEVEEVVDGEDAPVSDDVAASDVITIWVPDATVDFTKEKATAFLTENNLNYTVNVEAVGEGDAAGNMITDVQGGADVYNFAQDQIARLVSAGALTAVSDDYVEGVKANNDAGSVSAATVGDTVYAYPLTSDNGYFLYYDSSVISDPSTLEGILADCEAAGKSFYFEVNSGWYQTAFFFGAGAELTYDTDNDGNFTACNTTYNTEAGMNALKAMIALVESKAFVNGSSIGAADAGSIAAIVDGTWDSDPAKEVFGDNYACAKLPTFKGVDGKDHQLSGFGGFKLLGVKPQEDVNKLAACQALANYLSSGEVQIDRYNQVGWGPSNVEAQQNEAVQADVALSALGEQLAFTIPQGQYPGDYWTLATSLGDSMIQGEITSSTADDELQAVLDKFVATCESYCNAE